MDTCRGISLFCNWRILRLSGWNSKSFVREKTKRTGRTPEISYYREQFSHLTPQNGVGKRNHSGICLPSPGGPDWECHVFGTLSIASRCHWGRTVRRPQSYTVGVHDGKLRWLGHVLHFTTEFVHLLWKCSRILSQLVAQPRCCKVTVSGLSSRSN